MCNGGHLNGLLSLPSLAYLDISNNPINGLKALACLQKCSTLRHLVLQNNDNANGPGFTGTTTTINGKTVDRKSVFELLPQLISIDGMNRTGKMVDEEDEEDQGEEEEEEEDDDSLDKKRRQSTDLTRYSGSRSKGKGRSKGKTPRSKQPYVS